MSILSVFKVDREQRPDVDALYMSAVQAMTGSGGWPLSAFLAPDGRPFYGGTYFPPDDRYGRPGFKKILLAVADAWEHKREDLLDSADKLKQALSRSVEVSDSELSKDTIENAANVLARSFDPRYGGFGRAPKFPQPSQLSLLLRYWHKTGSAAHFKMVTDTLAAMARGGIYDHLGGGFHRYATDAKWLVPHFEKMLYDQALISQVCIEAYTIGGDPELARVVRETLDYVLRDMTDVHGGFYSAEDADSEGEEGTFYLWTPAQTRAVLGPQQAALFDAYYGVTEQGNFEHQTSILNVTEALDAVAASTGWPRQSWARHWTRPACACSRPGRSVFVRTVTTRSLRPGTACLSRHWPRRAQYCRKKNIWWPRKRRLTSFCPIWFRAIDYIGAWPRAGSAAPVFWRTTPFSLPVCWISMRPRFR